MGPMRQSLGLNAFPKRALSMLSTYCMLSRGWGLLKDGSASQNARRFRQQLSMRFCRLVMITLNMFKPTGVVINPAHANGTINGVGPWSLPFLLSLS